MDEEKLLNVALSYTNQIAELEDKLTMLRANRKLAIITLRREKVTARKISDVLGMSEQNVHKIVKGTR